MQITDIRDYIESENWLTWGILIKILIILMPLLVTVIVKYRQIGTLMRIILNREGLKNLIIV